MPREYKVINAQTTGDVLRRGEFSTVLKVKKGEITFLGRVLERQPSQEELEIYCSKLTEIRHDNIVKFVGCFIDENVQPVFVMENMDTPLEDLLMQENPLSPLSLSHKFSILLDIAKAIKYLHEHEVIHGMVIACNVYIDREAMTGKIAYLENAITRGIEPSHMRRQSNDTLKYMPPEITGAQFVYTTAVDIFSFGHLSIYIINQALPDFKNQSRLSEVEKRSSDISGMSDVLGTNHYGVAVLIKQCLSSRKEDRYITLVIHG